MAVPPQVIVLTLAVILGVFGNIPVIASICTKRSLLKNNHYYLLLHLAICDFFYLLIYVPQIYSGFTLEPYIKSYFSCKIVWPAHTVFFTAGAIFLTVISMIRYRAVLHPFKPAVRRRTLKLVSTFVYVFTVVCIIPYVLVLKFDETSGCYEEWPMEYLNTAYTIFLSGIQYFIPTSFLSVIYFKIGIEIMRRNKRVQPINARDQIRQENEKASSWFKRLRHRNIKPLFVSFTIVACFMISGFPAQTAYIYLVINSKLRPSYFLFFDALYIFGTAVVNPYVYGALDKKIFSVFKNCRKRMRR